MNRPLQPERRSGEPNASPRIYVASLTDYNAGRLHGAWLDAGTDAAELDAQIREMLSRSPTAAATGEKAEEWAIHDYENFRPLRLSEYDPTETVVAIATGIAEHGEAFAHWARLVGKDQADLDRFEDAYIGHWASVREYVDEMVGELGIDDALDKAISPGFRPYISIDINGLGRDMQLGGDLLVAETDDGVHLFDGHT